MPGRLRQKLGSERGFTMVELLVVLLILGILASIAIPALLNQKGKANDSQAKANARTLETAMEVCGNGDHNDFSSCGIDELRAIEPAIPQTGSTVSATSTAKTWSVTAVSSTENSFTITRNDSGGIDHTCTVPSGNDRGGCPPGGSSW